MSGTRAAPAGIDTLDSNDTALMEQMRSADDGGAPEPEIVAEPAAPAPEAAETSDDTDAGHTDVVPHKQFHAMNERRKAAEAKARETEQRLAVTQARFEERFNALAQVVQAATPPPPPPAPVEIPDVNVDPIGHFKALAQQLEAQIKPLAEKVQGFEQQGERGRQMAELRNWGLAQEQAFVQKEPSFYEAMNFLRESRHAELEAAGVADPMARNQIIAGDIEQIAIRARQEDANFAERLWNISSKRGYAPKAAAAANPALPPLDVGDRVQRAQAGRDAAVGLPTGSAPPAKLTPERIANMSDREFSAVYEKMKGDPAALRDLMGH